MIDYLPVWRDTEAIRGSSYEGFVRQFGKLQVKLKDYFGLLFREVGLVSVARSDLGRIGVCSFVSVPMEGLRFEFKLILDDQGCSIRVSAGAGATGNFVRKDDIEAIHFKVNESESWSDVSLQVLSCISKIILGVEIRNQTNA